MKPLKCEICGATELVKEGDFYVCQFCGVKYKADDIKKLIVSIEKSEEQKKEEALEKQNFYENVKLCLQYTYCNEDIENLKKTKNDKSVSSGWLILAILILLIFVARLIFVPAFKLSELPLQAWAEVIVCIGVMLYWYNARNEKNNIDKKINEVVQQQKEIGDRLLTNDCIPSAYWSRGHEMMQCFDVGITNMKEAAQFIAAQTPNIIEKHYHHVHSSR
ncbi:MAG: hypothetical protein Q4D21_10785 [Phascolarctobacterium sp.]|nr:hypothetical protein [Phascolarctobacterium sp.]